MANISSNNSSKIKLNNYIVTTSDKLFESRVKTIQKWVASLFMQTVKIGETLLEDGYLATAAEVFANATLLNNHPILFVAAVQRIYPSYFNRLYTLRMHIMGYEHLFTNQIYSIQTNHNVRIAGHGSPASSGQHII